MAEIYLIRHGQSCWNLANRFTGSINIPLTPKGRAEALEIADRFINIDFSHVFVSDLIRAQETALLALSTQKRTCELVESAPAIYDNLAIKTDARLNERDYGKLQGMNKDQARQEYGLEQVHSWRRAFSERPPAGESLADTVERVRPFYEHNLMPVLNAEPGAKIAIFAHGNSIRALHKLFLGLSSAEIIKFELKTGAVLHYSFDGARFDFHQ